MVENSLSNAHQSTFASAIGSFKLSNRYIVVVSPTGKIALLTYDLSAVAGAPSLETLAGRRIRAVAGKYKDCLLQLIEQTKESFRVNVLCKDGRTVMTYVRNKSVGYTSRTPRRRSPRRHDGSDTHVEPLPPITISESKVKDVLAIFGNQDDPLAAAQPEPEVDQPTEHVVETPVDAAGKEPVYPDRLEYVGGGQSDLDLESADGEAAEGAIDVVAEYINEKNNEEVDEGTAEGATEEAAVEAAEQAVEVEGESAKPFVQRLESPSSDRARVIIEAPSVQRQVIQQLEIPVAKFLLAEESNALAGELDKCHLVEDESSLVVDDDSTLVGEAFLPQEQPLVEAADPKALLAQHEFEQQLEVPVAEPDEAPASSSGKLDIHPSPAFVSGKKPRQGYNTEFLRKNLGGDVTRIRALKASIRKQNRKKRRNFPRPAFPWKWDEIRR